MSDTAPEITKDPPMMTDSSRTFMPEEDFTTPQPQKNFNLKKEDFSDFAQKSSPSFLQNLNDNTPNSSSGLTSSSQTEFSSPRDYLQTSFSNHDDPSAGGKILFIEGPANDNILYQKVRSYNNNLSKKLPETTVKQQSLLLEKLQKNFIFNETKLRATICNKKITLQQLREKKHILTKSENQYVEWLRELEHSKESLEDISYQLDFFTNKKKDSEKIISEIKLDIHKSFEANFAKSQETLNLSIQNRQEISKCILDS